MPDSPASKLADGIRYLRGGSLDRAWGCFEQAAEHTEDPRLRSEAYRRLADVKRRRAEWADALRLISQALAEAKAHGLKNEAAAARNIEGTIHLQRGEFERAVEVYRRALEEGPDAHQRGLICQNIGTAYAQKGMHGEAAEWYARSSAAFRIAGRRREELLALVNQGNMRMDQGELGAAETVFWEALVAVNELFSGDAELNGLIEMNLAEALALQGSRLDLALDLILAATGHFAASDNRPYRVACHRVLALISEKRGELETAVGALERGAALAREIGSGPDIASFEREASRLRGESGDIPPGSTV